MAQEIKMIEIRMNQLSAFWKSWKEDIYKGETVYGILSCIGYIRRLSVSGENLSKLRKIEIDIRHHLETILNAFDSFMEGSTLLELASKMQDSPKKDSIVTFFQNRDDSELAWQIAKEYTDEEYPQNWSIIGKIRAFLDKVDDIVLLNRDMVISLHEIGKQEERGYFDPEFFWWFSSVQKDCYLPHRRRDEYMADYIDNHLSSQLKTDFSRHILSCLDCHERWEMAREMIAEQNLADAIAFRPRFACAASEENPDVKRFIWVDDDEKWEVRLSIENSSCSFSNQKLYWDIRCRTEKKYNWQGIELQWGREKLKISKDGYAESTREDIENGLKEGNICVLCFSDGKEIRLKYRGEKDG